MSRLAQLEKLLAADPSDADVPYMIAQEHGASGRHDEAVAWYDRCLALDAGYLYAYYHKAKSLEAMGEGAAARALLRAGLARARSAGDGKAANELAAYLDELED